MGLDLIPQALRQKYRFDERHHACAILARDFPNEFKVYKSHRQRVIMVMRRNREWK
jgi:hypothetical protein